MFVEILSITPKASVNVNIQNKLNNNEEEYDPFKNRDVKNPISDMRSLLNLLKSSLGSGILAMPLAFRCSGLAVGVVCTILIGLMCTHCVKILVQQSQLICKEIKRPSLDYSETCEEAFKNGPKSVRKYATFIKYFSDFSLAFTYLGSCCVCVVLISKSGEQISQNYFGLFEYPSSTYSFLLLIPLLVIVQINNLKHLAPLSAVANLSLILICGICCYFIFQEIPPIENRELYTNFKDFPLFLSTVIFAMEGIGVVMPIENKMSNPSRFLGWFGILNISMAIVVFLYTLIGFFGYLKYGNEIMGIITLNLNMDSLYAKIAKYLFILGIFFSYPLHYYVFADIMWKYLKKLIHDDYKKITKVAMLSLGTVISVVVGALLPKVEAIIELVGAIFFTTLGLFIPALVELVYQWNRDLGTCNWKLWKDLFIMIFSILSLVCGVFHAITSLLE